MAGDETWRVSIHDDPPGVAIAADTADGVAQATGWLEEIDSRLVLTRLEFVARRPQDRGGITSSTVRGVRLDAGVARARGAVQHMQAVGLQGAPVHPGSEEMVEAWRARIEKLARAAVRQKAAGRRGYGDDFYRLVALEYLRLTEQGQGGRGVLTLLASSLAKRMGERQPRPRDNVRDWVAEARRRQFLAPGERGRGGASPGPLLYDDGGSA